jgi:hypothetical protein
MRQIIVISVWIVVVLIGVGGLFYYLGINGFGIFVCVGYVDLLVGILTIGWDRLMGSESTALTRTP